MYLSTGPHLMNILYIQNSLKNITYSCSNIYSDRLHLSLLPQNDFDYHNFNIIFMIDNLNSILGI